MMRAMHNVNNSDTELDASSGSSGNLLFRMLCNVAWSPPSSIEQEDDPGRAEVWCKVGDIVGSLIPSYLFWEQWRDFILKIFLWEDRLRVGFSHVTGWRGRRLVGRAGAQRCGTLAGPLPAACLGV